MWIILYSISYDKSDSYCLENWLSTSASISTANPSLWLVVTCKALTFHQSQSSEYCHFIAPSQQIVYFHYSQFVYLNSYILVYVNITHAMWQVFVKPYFNIPPLETSRFWYYLSGSSMVAIQTCVVKTTLKSLNTIFSSYCNRYWCVTCTLYYCIF